MASATSVPLPRWLKSWFDGFKSELPSIVNFHYAGELLLSTIFFILKMSPWCDQIFETCELRISEWELIASCSVIIMIRAKKQLTLRHYFHKVFIFAKVLNICLFYRHGTAYAIFYIAFVLLQHLFNPEPYYRGPELITHFRANALEEELKRDPSITWLVLFSAAWCPPCSDFAPQFSALSNDYVVHGALQFGKVDVGRYPEVAKAYSINTSSFTRQLPTLILFEEGEEAVRLPAFDAKGRISVPFGFSYDNVVKVLDMDDLKTKAQEAVAARGKGGREAAKKDQ